MANKRQYTYYASENLQNLYGHEYHREEWSQFSICKNKNKNNFMLHQIFKITNTSCQLFIDDYTCL